MPSDAESPGRIQLNDGLVAWLVISVGITLLVTTTIGHVVSNENLVIVVGVAHLAFILALWLIYEMRDSLPDWLVREGAT